MPSKPKTYFGKTDMKRQKTFIEKFMQSVDVPGWYRGLSSFQLEAANNLLNAIRDDLEQGTSHRVRGVLNTIGLRPPISKRRARFAMRLSRGNDLAFLWFLKDLYYYSEGPGYTLNEQLILSSIAHLDLIFTIRGLDGILPPEQPPKNKVKQNIEKQYKNEGEYQLKNQPVMCRKKHCGPRRISTVKKWYKLPYLERMRLPQPYGKSLTLQPPAQVLHLKFLDASKDPNYIVPNESSRWFAKYDLNYGRRTANSLVNENLDRIFQEDVVKIPSQVFEAQIFRDLRLSRRSSRMTTGSETGKKVILCQHHQVIEDLERNLEHELRVIARDKCRKYFDVETPKKEERIARLRKQIESDVNMHLGRFKEFANKSRSTLLLSEDNINDCSRADCVNNKENRLSGGQETKPNKKHQHRYVLSECGVERVSENCRLSNRKPLHAKCENSNPIQNRKYASGTEIIGDCLMNNNAGKSSKESKPQISSMQTRRFCPHCTCKSKSDLCDSAYEYVQSYDYGHSEANNGTKTYFNAPKKHRPFKFDYQKIFDVALTGGQADEIVKRACVGAIKSEEVMGVINTESKENVEAAIKKCTLETFRRKLENINENPQAERVDFSTTNSNFKYYDPDDNELMHRMLKEAMNRLTNDPRYVLPTLPDAHKMPILRYWIYQRFGKVYTQQEMMQIFKKSALLLRAVNKLTITEALPQSKNLGRAVYINYNCRDYLMKKAESIRDQFYKRVDDSIMEHSRRLYMAMGPYLFTGQSQNKTIFAYLPARPSDIHHFHVWNPRSYESRSKGHVCEPLASM